MKSQIEYLQDLISPPNYRVPVVYSQDIASEDWAARSLYGIIVVGEINQDAADLLYLALKPGAHLICIPTNDYDVSSVIVCEDRGFEVRDAIFNATHMGESFYTPKASKKERELGLIKSDTQTRANTHPTVKPIAIMSHLLRDVAPNAVVLDPFMGSGTTGCAAVSKGCDFIGIELEPTYAEIAKQRIAACKQQELLSK